MPKEDREILDAVIDAAIHVPSEVAARQQEPSNFDMYGIRRARADIDDFKKRRGLEGNPPELALLNSRANAGTGVRAYSHPYGQTAYLLNKPGERVCNLPSFYPQINLRGISSNQRAFTDAGRFDEFLGIFPAELICFSPVVSMTEETTQVTRKVPDPNYKEDTPPTPSFLGRLFRRPSTPSTPAVSQFIEKRFETTTEKFEPVPHPAGGVAIRYCYSLPDRRTLLAEPKSWYSDPVDSVGEGRQLTLADTPLKGNLEHLVSTILPEDVATALWRRTHERPEINRLIGARIAHRCIGGDIDNSHHNIRGFMQMPGAYADLPDNFGMRILRGDPCAAKPAGYIAEMHSVRVGSNTLVI